VKKERDMAIPGKNAELVQAAEVFAAAVKNFDGDPSEQMKLLKQADKLRFFCLRRRWILL
jgi:hypothetical protein